MLGEFPPRNEHFFKYFNESKTRLLNKTSKTIKFTFFQKFFFPVLFNVLNSFALTLFELICKKYFKCVLNKI
jgi:hypothetical protein